MLSPPSLLSEELQSQWPPNFSPALPLILLVFVWLYLLCLTLPSPSTTLKLVRLASLPLILRLVFRLAFDLRYTLGNPLRDLALPSLAWSLGVKAIEVCLLFTLGSLLDPARPGGPRWIRPFDLPASRKQSQKQNGVRARTDAPVTEMIVGQEASYEWRPVPFPSWFSWARLVYAVDVFTLKRPGTSLLLPRQGRALEWSGDELNAWTAYLRREKKLPHEVRRDAPVLRFGQSETSIAVATVQFLLVYLGLRWIYWLASPASPTLCAAGIVLPVTKQTSSTLLQAAPWLFRQCTSLVRLPSFFQLPYASQTLMVLVHGAGVCFGPALPEALLLSVFRPNPPTSYLAAFDRPLSSHSLSRLWARGWHRFHQRDFVFLSSLLPYGRTEVGKLVGSFFWSSVVHSFMFCRLRSAPLSMGPRSVLLSLYDEGMYIFFLSQAVGILLERQALRLVKSSESGMGIHHRRTIAWLRKGWMVVVLLVPGRYFAEAVLGKGLMTKGIMDGFSPRALGRMLRGEMY